MAKFQDDWRAGGKGNGAYVLQSRDATQIPFVAKGTSGQTASLIEAHNSAGTTVFSVSNEGNVMWIGSTIIVVDEVITGNLTVGGNTILGDASSDTLTVNATSTFNADVNFSNSLLLPDGALGAPALGFTNDTDMGFFRNALNQMTLVTNGSARMLWTNNSISSYVNFIPTVSDGAALGTNTFMWSDLKLASGGVISFNAGNVTITHSTGVLTLAGDLLASNAAGPAFIDEAATATNPTLCPDKAEEDTGIGWASDTIHFVGGGSTMGNIDIDGLDIVGDVSVGDDLLLASANVINWDSGDITLTHSAAKLTFGGDGAVEIDFNNHEMTNVDINSGTINGITDLAIADGGTGASTLAGASIPTYTSTNTFTNKRVTPRVSTEASSATPTINTDNVDAHSITALAAAITSMTTNLSGTPTNFDKLVIRFLDNGTARAIAWGASYEDKGVALPVTTVISKTLTVGLIYDTATSKWGAVSVAQEL